jgi:hypothetical protein
MLSRNFAMSGVVPVGQVAGADDAADRAGDERRRELVGVDRDRAAVRGHHPQLEGGAALFGAVADGAQGAARGLGGVGLDHRRVEAREVAARGVELGGDEDRAGPVDAPFGLLLLDDLADPLLVRRVAVAEDQRDDDPLDLVVEQRVDRHAGVLLT